MPTKLDQAIVLVENGEIEKGLSLIEGYKQNCSDDEKYIIAELYVKWGFVEEAKDILEELIAIYPDEGELYVLLSEILIEQDKEEEAIAILDNIDEDDPVYAQSLLLMADLYQMQGLSEVSEQKLLLAKKKVMDEPIIDFALAELYLSQGEYKKCIPFYKDILKHEEVVAGVSVNARIAEALSAIGEFEEALPFYEKAMKIGEDSHSLFGYGFTAFNAGYFKKTIELFTKLKEQDPDYISLYLYLARSYETEELLEESLQVLQEGLNVDSLNKELHLAAAKISIKLGDQQGTEQHLREAVAVDPGYIEATLMLSQYLIRHERYEDVVECLTQVMSYGEYDLQYEWDLAFAKKHLEQYSDALNHYRQAYTFFKDNVVFLEEFGYFLLEEGEREEAVMVFKHLLSIDSSNYVIEELLAEFGE